MNMSLNCSRSSFVMNTSSIPNQGIYRKCPQSPYISTEQAAIVATAAKGCFEPASGRLFLTLHGLGNGSFVRLSAVPPP